MLMVHYSLVCMFNSSHLKKKKKDFYAGRRREGKTQVIHGEDGDRRNIKSARNIQEPVPMVGQEIR